MKKIRLIACMTMLATMLCSCGTQVENTSKADEDDIVVITDDEWRNKMEMVETTIESSKTEEEENQQSTVQEATSSLNAVETTAISTTEGTSSTTPKETGTKVQTTFEQSTKATTPSTETLTTKATETEMTAPDILQILEGSGVEENAEPDLSAPSYWDINWDNGNDTPPTPVLETGNDVNPVIPTSLGNAKEQVVVQDIPQKVRDTIQVVKSNYPNAQIAVGLFDLTTLEGYVYNPNQQISAGCTIKAAYALYVLKTCDEQNIDITTERIVLKKSDCHGGSGVILQKLSSLGREANPYASTSDAYLKYGDAFTVEDLLTVLLGESDNIAYEMLYDRFDMAGFRKFLDSIGGQTLQRTSGIGRDGYQMYGAPTVYERLNEWYAIYQYINAGQKYSDQLKDMLTGTKYCYAVGWMNSYHNYMHKSGWIEGSNSCAADCCLLDGRYLLIVLMSDSREDISNANEIRRIGSAAEVYLRPEYFQFGN